MDKTPMDREADELFVEAAVEGGYLYQGHAPYFCDMGFGYKYLDDGELGSGEEEFMQIPLSDVLLDPDLWRCASKRLKWEAGPGEWSYIVTSIPEQAMELAVTVRRPLWEHCWHGMLDAIKVGVPVERYIKSLLTDYSSE